MTSSIDLHKCAGVIFGITRKPLYITPSNLVRQYITKKEIFLNLFCNLKRDWPLVPGHWSLLFLITLSILRDWAGKKKQGSLF